MYTDNVAVLFSKRSVKRFRAVQMETSICMNTRGVAYFACVSGRSCLSPGKRSIENCLLIRPFDIVSRAIRQS